MEWLDAEDKQRLADLDVEFDVLDIYKRNARYGPIFQLVVEIGGEGFNLALRAGAVPARDGLLNAWLSYFATGGARPTTMKLVKSGRMFLVKEVTA